MNHAPISHLLITLAAVAACAARAGAASVAKPKPQTHQIVAEKYFLTYSRAHSVLLRIRPGDIVATKTLDSGGQDDKGVRQSVPGNPLTGAFYVEGAEPGDALMIHIRKLTLSRNWGYTANRLILPSLLPEAIEGIYSSSYKLDLVRQGRSNLLPWEIDIERKVVRLREPKSAVHKMEFPARPMLGCIGVAPAGDFAPTAAPAGTYGGNIDYNEIREGVVVTLPVYHPGGLIFIGDGHALQGDGEAVGTGVETPLDVEFSVELQKNATLLGPRVENDEFIISIGSQPEFVSSLDRAPDGDQRYGKMAGVRLCARALGGPFADWLPSAVSCGDCRRIDGGEDSEEDPSTQAEDVRARRNGESSGAGSVRGMVPNSYLPSWSYPRLVLGLSPVKRIGTSFRTGLVQSFAQESNRGQSEDQPDQANVQRFLGDQMIIPNSDRCK